MTNGVDPDPDIPVMPFKFGKLVLLNEMFSSTEKIKIL